MNRRQFLTRALASVPLVLAGEQLAELLVPRKAIFLPPRGGWAAGQARITGVWVHANYFFDNPAGDHFAFHFHPRQIKRVSDGANIWIHHVIPLKESI